MNTQKSWNILNQEYLDENPDETSQGRSVKFYATVTDTSTPAQVLPESPQKPE